MEILLFIVAHWYLSLFAQSFFNHRYAAHQGFTMSPFTEKVFFIYSFLAQGSSYMSPWVYAYLHRMHHVHADKERDPHSPIKDPNVFVLMWKTYLIFSDIQSGKAEIDESCKKGYVPRWDAFDRFARSYFVKISWGAVYLLFYIKFATFWWMYLFLPVHFLMGPLHGTVINWFAHKFGYVSFKVDNTSKNIMPVDIFMLGEGYHNNHHAFGSDPKFSKKWFEIDPVWMVIKVFKVLRIIKPVGGN